MHNNSLSNADKALELFTVLVEPAIQQSIQQIVQHAQSSSPQLAAILPTKRLTTLIRHDLVALCKPIVARVCVLEMHTLSSNNQLVGDNSKQRFNYFVEQLGTEDVRVAFKQKYPILFEQVDIQTQNYAAAMCELLARLAADHEMIANTFLGAEAEKFSINNISVAGDRHVQGRGVCIIDYKSQAKTVSVVYKPRSLGVEIAFYDFLDWLSNSGFELTYKNPQIIDKKDYGWVQFIKHESCASNAELSNFYLRFGGLLAVMQMLIGSDIHAENIIAAGEFPVIIDLECLLRPYIKSTPEASIQDVSRFFVCNTCFLPERMKSADAAASIDISAYSGEGGGQTVREAIDWEHVGTDKMAVKRSHSIIPAFLNRPTLNNSRINPLDFQAEFLQGFKNMYRVIMQNQASLSATNSPLKIFEKVKLRVVLRSTGVYASQINESYHPKFMYTPGMRNEYLQQIEMQEERLDVFTAEIADMESGNVPYFYTHAEDDAIYSSTSKAMSMQVLITGYQRMLNQLQQHFTEEDLRNQVDIIQASFAAFQLSKSDSVVSKKYRAHFTGQPSSLDDLQVRVNAIIHKQLKCLENGMIRNCGRVYWPCVLKGSEGIYTSSFTDIDLYDGVAGIGLTFAYAAHIYKDNAYRNIALDCANSINMTLNTKDAAFFQSIGGYSGLGGIIYALHYFSKILDHKESATNIDKCCSYLQELIPQDMFFDIIGGAAGCLAALIAAKESIQPKQFAQLTRQCVDHILQHYKDPSMIPEQMKNDIIDKSLLGLSHGVSGILWALDKYDALFPGDADIKSWIERALIYERSLFSAQLGAWPDLRTTSEMSYPNMWCHGAPGIVLSRSTISPGWRDAVFEDEINLAHQTIINKGFGYYINLCHGDLGNLECINSDDPMYLTQLNSMITNIEQHGVQTGLIASKFTPGIMTGIAGVAFALMRIYKKDVMPSILLLE